MNGALIVVSANRCERKAEGISRVELTVEHTRGVGPNAFAVSRSYRMCNAVVVGPGYRGASFDCYGGWVKREVSDLYRRAAAVGC